MLALAYTTGRVRPRRAFRFDIELDVNKCSVDTSDDTIVIILAKTMTTEIQRMMAGTSATELVERKFLTTSNVSQLYPETLRLTPAGGRCC